MTVPDATGSKPRRDVQRNLAALLDAATTIFAESGVSAPAKQITDLAGVGVGTLYRHFPKRSDLIVAVLRHELDECVQVAIDLGSTHEAAEALRETVRRFVGLVRTKHGLAEALHSNDPAYDGLPHALLDGLEPAVDHILETGRARGTIRPDARAREILVGVGLLCQPVPGEDDAFNERLVQMLVDGVTVSVPVPASRSSTRPPGARCNARSTAS